MDKITTFFFLFLAVLISSSKAHSEEIEFKLEDHQKLVGTYSGDIDQQISVHLAIINDKSADNYIIRPYLITEKDEIISLNDAVVTVQPSIVSFHYNPGTSNLTLLVEQEMKPHRRLEIIDFNALSNSVSSVSVKYRQKPEVVIRSKDRTFLVFKDPRFKENTTVKIKTIYDSKTDHMETFEFKDEVRDMVRRIFNDEPESINTNEFVENGSINASKVYFFNDRLIFDHTSKKKYASLSVHPENASDILFKEIDLEDVGKVTDINSFIYGSKTFLFINNKEDINLRIYDRQSGELLADVFLKRDLSDSLNKVDLEKIIYKTSWRSHSLTGTVNEGSDSSMLVNIDLVQTNTYKYDYNWWWFNQFFLQQMMWEHQMMQQQMKMQMNAFGPDPDSYLPGEFREEKTRPIQLVIDKGFNFLDGRDAISKRPNIDKDKFIKKFEDDRQLKDVSLAFTLNSGRAIYYSKTTDMVHIKIFDF